MAKVDYRDLSAKERRAALDSLTDIIVLLKRKKDAREFIQRLLTPSEIIMLARRINIANLLVNGASYATIQSKLKVGVSTIRTVDQWLEHAVREYNEIRAEKKRQQKEAKFKGGREYEPRGPGTIAYVRGVDFEELFHLILSDLKK